MGRPLQIVTNSLPVATLFTTGAGADVIVVAVWLDDFKQFIAQYGDRLAGKVIVDPSNPVGPDGAGGYRKVIGEQESSGQILAGLLPAGARLVKAFGTLSAG